MNPASQLFQALVIFNQERPRAGEFLKREMISCFFRNDSKEEKCYKGHLFREF